MIRAIVLLTLVAILGPMFALNLARSLATGFALGPSLEEVAIKEAFVGVWLLIPVAALAATAADFTELLVLAATLIAAYGDGALVAALAFGPDACPTCGTGIVWIEHTIEHVRSRLRAP